MLNPASWTQIARKTSFSSLWRKWAQYGKRKFSWWSQATFTVTFDHKLLSKSQYYSSELIIFLKFDIILTGKRFDYVPMIFLFIILMIYDYDYIKFQVQFHSDVLIQSSESNHLFQSQIAFFLITWNRNVAGRVRFNVPGQTSGSF